MLISFRATKTVHKYLKGLKNKSKEINDILESYILQSKQPPTRVAGGLDKEVTYVNIEEMMTEKQLEREAPLFQEPIQEIVKDKKYYENLAKYNTIKSMGGCFSGSGERLDTQEALQYANLQSFIE